jgi:hypothetical protein
VPPLLPAFSCLPARSSFFLPLLTVSAHTQHGLANVFHLLKQLFAADFVLLPVGG